MKKCSLFCIAASCMLSSVQAQSVRSIDFNTYVSTTNNDLVNNFTGGFLMTQQTTGGITGGSIVPAASLTANKGAYSGRCYLRPTDPNPTTVSISFKYSAAGAASGDGGPEVGFFITSDSSGSLATGFVTANISAYPFGGSMFNVDGPGDHSGSGAFNLVDGHWYQLELRIKAINMDSINTNCYVYDLGATGTSTPVLKSSFLNNIETTVGITWPHSFFVPTINGGASGGVVAMDNFSLNSYTAPANVADAQMISDRIVVSNPVNDILYVNTSVVGYTQYTIYNIAGCTVSYGGINGSEEIDVSGLQPSLYLIRFMSQGQTTVRKFIKL